MLREPEEFFFLSERGREGEGGRGLGRKGKKGGREGCRVREGDVGLEGKESGGPLWVWSRAWRWLPFWVWQRAE